MAPTNALLIGSISADEANACLRCPQKNAATPLSYCSPGTYTLRYRRSMPSTCSVTCSRKISATLRGRLMAGSGRWRSLEDLPPARRAIGSDSIASRVVHSTGALHWASHTNNPLPAYLGHQRYAQSSVVLGHHR